jgi:hypothetical protein
LEDLLRWQDSGGLWRVDARTAQGLRLTLLSCSGTEEMAQLVTDDAQVLEFVGQRWTSQEGPPL